MALDAATVLELRKTVATGMSSQGLLDWLYEGNTDPESYKGYRPADNGDLGRCQATFGALDPENQAIAAPLMALFNAEVNAFNVRMATQQADLTSQLSQAASARDDQRKAETNRTIELTGPQVFAVRTLLSSIDVSELEGWSVQDDAALHGILAKLAPASS